MARSETRFSAVGRSNTPINLGRNPASKGSSSASRNPPNSKNSTKGGSRFASTASPADAATIDAPGPNTNQPVSSQAKNGTSTAINRAVKATAANVKTLFESTGKGAGRALDKFAETQIGGTAYNSFSERQGGVVPPGLGAEAQDLVNQNALAGTYQGGGLFGQTQNQARDLLAYSGLGNNSGGFLNASGMFANSGGGMMPMNSAPPAQPQATPTPSSTQNSTPPNPSSTPTPSQTQPTPVTTPAPLPAKEEVKKEEPKAEPAKEEVKKEEPKAEPAKEEVKKEEPKAEPAKEEVKKEEPKAEPAK